MGTLVEGKVIVLNWSYAYGCCSFIYHLSLIRLIVHRKQAFEVILLWSCLWSIMVQAWNLVVSAHMVELIGEANLWVTVWTETLPGAQVWKRSWKISWSDAFQGVWWTDFWAWSNIRLQRKFDQWKQWMACNLYGWCRGHDADRRLSMAVKNQNPCYGLRKCVWWCYD